MDQQSAETQLKNSLLASGIELACVSPYEAGQSSITNQFMAKNANLELRKLFFNRRINR
jgi:hypothetical protein